MSLRLKMVVGILSAVALFCLYLAFVTSDMPLSEIERQCMHYAVQTGRDTKFVKNPDECYVRINDTLWVPRSEVVTVAP